MEDCIFDEMKEITERINNTTKEDWMSAFSRASEIIENLKEENEGLEQGFEYWETQYNQLKDGVNRFLYSDQKTEDIIELKELLK